MAAPPWSFPVPVRPSRFRAGSAEWEPYNVEVALDRIPPFAFDGVTDDGPCLWYDLHTGLEGSPPGRLGSGRGGTYRDRYLKGVGRTPAAGNWRDAADRYSGSGHLSVASALRERLVTIALGDLGLADTVVGCEAVLLAPLTLAEQEAVAAGRTSSRPAMTAADATLVALSVKAAGFARPANVVHALEHACRGPRDVGRLFLALERHLRPPGDRDAAVGAPGDVVAALEAGFEAALRNFEAFARIGLHWMFVTSNATLDGRFVDLETPTFFGRPFVGLHHVERGRPRLLGFEELLVVREWRLFIAWLRARVAYLRLPELSAASPARGFLRELAERLERTFSPSHLLHDDAALVRRAVANLEAVLDLGPTGRHQLAELARFALRGYLYGADERLPDVRWRPVDDPPAPAVPHVTRYDAAGFVDPGLTQEAERMADDLARLGAIDDLDTLLDALNDGRPAEAGLPCE